MTARRVAARRLIFAFGLALPAGLVAAAVAAGCYTGGGGTDPPENSFYFPGGLAVSKGGNALYAVNSDFDLQWNGGTFQSYDLFLLRHDANELINANLQVASSLQICANSTDTDPGCVPVLNTSWTPANCQNASTSNASAVTNPSNGARNPLGETCAPPVASSHYERSSSIIGAFATQLTLTEALTDDGRRRLFAPIGGNASITWGDVPEDSLTMLPASDVGTNPSLPPGITTFDDTNNSPTSPFAIDCGVDSSGRCGGSHQAGNFIDPNDTRSVTLPGQPFAIALSGDDSAIVVTHQTSNQTSLLLSGVGPDSQQRQIVDGGVVRDPSMQFVLSGVPSGGDGITAIPHDTSAHSPAPGCEFFPPGQRPPNCVRPSFLETNHSAAEIDLIRYFDDFGATLGRPFIEREVAYPLNALEGGNDTRGIVVDPTPRLQCRWAVSMAFQSAPSAAHGAIAPDLQGTTPVLIDPCDSAPNGEACAQWIACGTTPSRVFFASRTPPALVVGQIGGPSASGNGTFDPDRLTIGKPVPLAVGASTVYLAPIVNRLGNYELRVFIVCFDSNQVFVYNPAFANTANPENGVENVIEVGAGPFAMAFDPFDLNDVARGAAVPPDLRQQDPVHLKTYRFAYLALFTNSYLQVIDLDDSLPDVSARTFENVVFTLGQPTTPKGT